MRLVAKEVPFSSIVGKSVVLTDSRTGRVVAQLGIMVPTPSDDYKAIAKQLVPVLLNAWPPDVVGTPKTKGHYWGQWRIKEEGTADEDDPPGKEWEVMHVVDDFEKLMVMVPGVAKFQSLENFIWGAKVPDHE